MLLHTCMCVDESAMYTLATEEILRGKSLIFNGDIFLFSLQVYADGIKPQLAW